MAHPRKKTRPRKNPKKTARFFSIKRVFLFFLLSGLFLFSVCAVSYVIFFRTVFAQEIPLNSYTTDIIFEEPDPPIHKESFSVPSEGSPVPEKRTPKVAIIIDDLGYHQEIGEKLLNFPFELTYSFLPFAPFTGKQERFALDSGKTILLHLPLEPKGSHWDPGPGALFLADSPEVQKEKFLLALAAVPHAVGVNNHMGSRFTEDRQAMIRLMREVQEQELFFIDSFTTADSVGLTVAQELGVQSSRRHVFLDNVLDEEEICKQLERLVNVAELQGVAIGIGHPHLETYLALKHCLGLYTDVVEFVRIGEVLAGETTD